MNKEAKLRTAAEMHAPAVVTLPTLPPLGGLVDAKNLLALSEQATQAAKRRIEEIQVKREELFHFPPRIEAAEKALAHARGLHGSHLAIKESAPAEALRGFYQNDPYGQVGLKAYERLLAVERALEDWPRIEAVFLSSLDKLRADHVGLEAEVVSLIQGTDEALIATPWTHDTIGPVEKDRRLWIMRKNGLQDTPEYKELEDCTPKFRSIQDGIEEEARRREILD